MGARTSPSEVTQTYAFAAVEPKNHRFNVFSAFAQDEMRVHAENVLVTAA